MSESLWNRCLRVLESELPEQQFNTWVRPLQAIERDGELKLLAPNRYVSEWLGQNWLPRIKELVRALAEEPIPEVLADVGTGSMQVTGIESTFHSATQTKTTGQINELGDLREAARVLSGHGCVNRRLCKLELDSLPFRLLCPIAAI